MTHIIYFTAVGSINFVKTCIYKNFYIYIRDIVLYFQVFHYRLYYTNINYLDGWFVWNKIHYLYKNFSFYTNYLKIGGNSLLIIRIVSWVEKWKVMCPPFKKMFLAFLLSSLQAFNLLPYIYRLALTMKNYGRLSYFDVFGQFLKYLKFLDFLILTYPWKIVKNVGAFSSVFYLIQPNSQMYVKK